MKTNFWWLWLLIVCMVAGCAPSVAPTSGQAVFDMAKVKVEVQNRTDCSSQQDDNAEGAITGMDSDGIVLSYWTTSLSAVKTAYDEAVAMCGPISMEQMDLTYPDYRCQIRVNFNIDVTKCKFPQ